MAGIFIRDKWILNPGTESSTYNEKICELPQINKNYCYVAIDDAYYERFLYNISEEERVKIKEYEKKGIAKLFEKSTNGTEINIKALGFSNQAIEYIISKALIDQEYNLSVQEETKLCDALFGIKENNNELYMGISKLGLDNSPHGALQDILSHLPQVIQIATEEYDGKIPLNMMIQDEKSKYKILMQTLNKIEPSNEVLKLFLEGKYRRIFFRGNFSVCN